MNRLTALAATVALAAGSLALTTPTQAAPAKAQAYKVTAKANIEVAVAKEDTVKVKGRVTPKAAGQKVILQQRVGNKKKWTSTGNAKVKKNGKGTVSLTSEEAGGRTYYTIRSSEGNKMGFTWVYEEGYLLAGPSRALLERAIQQRDSGVSLASTAKFRDLLGPDGQVNVSALVYQNLAPLVEAADKVVPDSVQQRGGRGPEALKNLLIGQGPTLYYAYAETDRIVMAGSNQNPLGLNLSTLAGLGGFIGGIGEGHHGETEDAR